MAAFFNGSLFCQRQLLFLTVVAFFQRHPLCSLSQHCQFQKLSHCVNVAAFDGRFFERQPFYLYSGCCMNGSRYSLTVAIVAGMMQFIQ
jgi:hypothetical protein